MTADPTTTPADEPIDRQRIRYLLGKLTHVGRVQESLRRELLRKSDDDLRPFVQGIETLADMTGIDKPAEPSQPPADEDEHDVMMRGVNNAWLDDLLSNKEYDTAQLFAHQVGPGFPHTYMVSLGEIRRAYQNAPLDEQTKIKEKLEALNTGRGGMTCMDYLGQLGGALAQQYDRGAINPAEVPENTDTIPRYTRNGQRFGRVAQDGTCPVCHGVYGADGECYNCTDMYGLPARPDSMSGHRWKQFTDSAMWDRAENGDGTLTQLANDLGAVMVVSRAADNVQNQARQDQQYGVTRTSHERNLRAQRDERARLQQQVPDRTAPESGTRVNPYSEAYGEGVNAYDGSKAQPIFGDYPARFEDGPVGTHLEDKKNFAAGWAQAHQDAVQAAEQALLEGQPYQWNDNVVPPTTYEVPDGEVVFRHADGTSSVTPKAPERSPVDLYVDDTGTLVRSVNGPKAPKAERRDEDGKLHTYRPQGVLRPATRAEIADAGRSSGVCMICGRTLIGNSVAEGIGPKCRTKMRG